MIRPLFATIALLASVPAQTTSSSYVQDSVTGFSGNTVPLGCASSGLFAEGRSQILIPARYLAGPNAVLTGLAAVGNNRRSGAVLLFPTRLDLSRFLQPSAASPTHHAWTLRLGRVPIPVHSTH